MFVTSRKQRFTLQGRQLIGRAVPAAGLDESQRAVIHHDMFGEKFLRRRIPRSKHSPKPAAAAFRACGGERVDWPAWMFVRGTTYLCFDSQPIAHRGDFTERHPGLNHAERAW